MENNRDNGKTKYCNKVFTKGNGAMLLIVLFIYAEHEIYTLSLDE